MQRNTQKELAEMATDLGKTATRWGAPPPAAPLLADGVWQEVSSRLRLEGTWVLRRPAVLYVPPGGAPAPRVSRVQWTEESVSVELQAAKGGGRCADLPPPRLGLPSAAP
eukprot:TRINITY_DN29516_c0_g1_i1.p3 TRINITY_DN29516_c0_g1~~TRINITY_DN29516_c0_g1_i1.p3  ORF type:complete len:125 (+),score=41.04 TRINITY_DN29516_c0_g1_i1:46-375(+)